jgi:hypothetical protein
VESPCRAETIAAQSQPSNREMEVQKRVPLPGSRNRHLEQSQPSAQSQPSEQIPAQSRAMAKKPERGADFSGETIVRLEKISAPDGQARRVQAGRAFKAGQISKAGPASEADPAPAPSQAPALAKDRLVQAASQPGRVRNQRSEAVVQSATSRVPSTEAHPPTAHLGPIETSAQM